MTTTATETKSRPITLSGSAQLVAEFFEYGVHSILYQRGVYPAESFARTQKYGLTVWMSNDEKINDFLNRLGKQLRIWLEEDKVAKLVVVLAAVDTAETLERWEFLVDREDKENNAACEATSTSAKELKVIQAEIRDVIRQIVASVTFLPLLDTLCSFDILVHTKKTAQVPADFGESDAKLIANSEQVQLKSFSTGIHKVETVISYKAPTLN